MSVRPARSPSTSALSVFTALVVTLHMALAPSGSAMAASPTVKEAPASTATSPAPAPAPAVTAAQDGGASAASGAPATGAPSASGAPTAGVPGAAPVAVPAALKPIASIEGISEYRLENGLTVLLAPDASKPTTTVNMTYKVGSRHENYGETGMAHLLEHMLFKGTHNVRNALGEFSRRGLSANGSTSSDRTNYYASFSANADTLDWYLGWQADAMVNAIIAREDLDSEMTVVRNEMDRGENSPFRILMQKMSASAYVWHNYGKDTIGARSDVENVDIEQLRAFYRTYYQPDNAVLIVSGAFDPQRVLATIARVFEPLPKPQRALPRLYTVEPVQDGERSVTLRRHGGSPLVAAMYHTPAAADPSFAAVELATAILGDTPSGRLYHALVGKDLASGVFGFTMDRHDPSILMFGAELDEGMDQNAALTTLTSTLESLAKTPITQEELDRAKNLWLNNWQMAYSDPEDVGVSLSEAIAVGDWRMFFLQRDRIRNVELKDVQQAAEKWLVQSNRTEGRYIPTEQPLRAPAASPVDFDATFQNYKGDSAFKAADAFDTSAQNIEQATVRETLTLPNGKVELALLDKPTRGDRVQAQLSVRSGDAKMLEGTRATATTVGAMMLRGTPTMSRQQIQDTFARLNATVNIGSGPGVLDASISTTRENLPDVLKTVLEIIHTADFPHQQLAELTRELSTSIQQNRNEPQALAARALARHNNPWPVNDVRYVPTFDEVLAESRAVKREALSKYRDQFVGTGAVTFSAVGAFDAAAVKDTLTQGLKPWPKAPVYARITEPYREVKPERFDIITPDKANAFYLSRQWLPVQDTDADYPALTLANFLLGASEKSRLWLRVREKEGLSYSVRSNLAASAFEASGSWTIYAIYAPGDRERLEKAIQEELARVIKDGFSEEEVADAKQAMLNYRALARAQDAVLASTWSTYLEQGRTFAWSVARDADIAALTADSVNAALRKHLKVSDFSEALAGDFRKK